MPSPFNLTKITAPVTELIAQYLPEDWDHNNYENLKFIVFIALGLSVLLPTLLTAMRGMPIMLSLHGYQHDFLAAVGKMRSVDVNSALQSFCDWAHNEADVHKAVFDDFHCIHCGSVAPADWIKTRKGEKTPFKFYPSPRAVALLNSKVLVGVEKRGDPPTKQVVDGPRRSDASKAARCLVDWAIKSYGAVQDGVPKEKETKAE